MNLARNRFGQIGRQIQSSDFNSRVAQPPRAIYAPGLGVSEQSVVRDDAYFKAVAFHNQQVQWRDMRQKIANQRALNERNQRQRAQISGYQAQASWSPNRPDSMNEKLRQHYIKTGAMGQTAQVANSLYHNPVAPMAPVLFNNPHGATSGQKLKERPPADFSSSGANMHLLPQSNAQDPVVWHSDYRQTLFKGNPLTRDGKFGPAVTDYDRFVNGTDVNGAEIGGQKMMLAGGTMAGRYEGRNIPAGMSGVGRHQVRHNLLGPPPAKKPRRRAMGDEFDDFEAAPDDPGSDWTDWEDDSSGGDLEAEFDALPADESDSLEAEFEALPDDSPEAQPGFFDKLWTAAELEATKSIPKIAKDQALRALAAGGSVTQNPAGGGIIIRQPGAPTVRARVPMVSSKMITYAAVGMLGIGAILMAMKFIKAPRTA